MSTKKAPKKAPKGGWHSADIKAALEKAGWSLRRLSLHHGYKTNALKEALYRPYPRAERLIAQAIGVHPANIWPDRYNGDDRTGAITTPKVHSKVCAA